MTALNFSNWSTTNLIALGSLIVSIGTAILLIRNFILGQKQTKLSLAINQFKIYKEELDGFINEAKSIKFKSIREELTKPYKNSYEESDGIFYIHLFLIIDHIKFLSPESEERRLLISDFRGQVIFPLLKFYDKLFHFLVRIYKDEVLSKDYKKILYNYIERDLLQTYFRIANNKNLGEEMQYDLSVFETPVFKKDTFYRINQFYIYRDIFQYKNQDFYIKTL